ncbi:hypothetical protein ACFVYG_25975 [Streptomyces sp. NPDC058256]|uniref:hypothetical protein n=1 Tax=Streptomyces sp. NPDC058256 TaxID=3346408 RepID=UPI0036E38F3E
MEARNWLTELVVAHEVGMGFGEDSPVRSPNSPSIGMVWGPRDPGEEDSVFLLVRAAQEASMVTNPDETTITFEYIEDGDQGVFRWFVDIVAPTPLKVATTSEAMAVLGEPQTFGVDAAMAILRDAVQAANLLIQQLSDYVAATKMPGHDS